MNKPDAAAKGHLGTNCALDYITFSGAVACGTMTNVGKMCGLFFDPITDPSLAQSVVGVCGKKNINLMSLDPYLRPHTYILVSHLKTEKVA